MDGNISGNLPLYSRINVTFIVNNESCVVTRGLIAIGWMVPVGSFLSGSFSPSAGIDARAPKQHLLVC